MGITLRHKYRWHATTETKNKIINNIVQMIIVRVSANHDEIMG